MKRISIFLSLLFIGLIALSGCKQKSVEGTIISVPVTMSLNELMSGEVSNMTFSGDLVKVRLDTGEEVEALATHEQMEQAFKGKNKATLEKIKDEEHEGVGWIVINLEEPEEEVQQEKE